MNKTLLLILIPCIVAFAMVQSQGIYYGYPASYPRPYPRAAAYGYGYARGSRNNYNQLLTYGLIFLFALIFLNLSGTS